MPGSLRLHRIVSLVAFVSCAGTSHAAFSLNSVDAAECPAGSFGLGIFTTTTFAQHPVGDNYPPSATIIGLLPALADDSYVAMDSVGPSTASHTSSAPGGSPNGSSTTRFFDRPDRVDGGWFTAGGVPNGTSPAGRDGVFIAQLTTDGALSGRVRVNTSGAIDGTFTLDLNGQGEGRLLARTYPTRAAADGVSTVYEVWVEVPAPGTIVVLGCAGGLAWRRQR